MARPCDHEERRPGAREAGVPGTEDGRPVVPSDASPQQRARATQHLVHVTGAVGRTLAGRGGLARRGPYWHLDGTPLPARAPHLHPRAELDDWSSFRGATDAVALLVRHSNPALRARTCPAGDVLAVLVFEMLEQFRVESLADPSLPGVRRNLDRRFATWTDQVVGSGLLESEQGLIALTLAHMSRSRLLSTEIPDSVAALIEATRFGLAPAIGTPLDRLRALRADQAAYAEPAVEIARAVAALVAAAREDEPGGDDEDEAEEPLELFSLLVGFEQEGHTSVPVLTGPGRELATEGTGYRVFTRAYDRVDDAAGLVPRAERDALHRELGELVHGSGLQAQRLAHHLFSVLGVPESRGWAQDEEEGHLDPSRLPRLVTRPGEGTVFRVPRPATGVHTALTFLLDASGSMKAHRARLAPLLEVWVKALQLAGVQVEVLGHTTTSWGGVRARKDWQRAGRPVAPGRLAETQHLVLVAATGSGHRVRQGLSALLRTSLYRESVDGEAVQWAAGRLAETEAQRRILAVVSDGSPTETSTARANNPEYLDRHLSDVLAGLDALAGRGRAGAGAIEAFGVGVGLDLSTYYNRYTVLDLDKPLATVSRDLLAGLAGLPRR